MNNKFIWELKRFNINKHQIVYIINCLKNKSLFMIKTIIFVYFKLHPGIILINLWIFLDNQYMNDKLKTKALNKL